LNSRLAHDGRWGPPSGRNRAAYARRQTEPHANRFCEKTISHLFMEPMLLALCPKLGVLPMTSGAQNLPGSTPESTSPSGGGKHASSRCRVGCCATRPGCLFSGGCFLEWSTVMVETLTYWLADAAQGPVTQRLAAGFRAASPGLAWAPHAATARIASAEGELILVTFRPAWIGPSRRQRCRQSGLLTPWMLQLWPNWRAAAERAGLFRSGGLDGDLPQRMSVPPVGAGSINWPGKPGGCGCAVARGAEIWIWNRDDSLAAAAAQSQALAVMALKLRVQLGDQLAAGTGQGGVYLGPAAGLSASCRATLQLENGLVGVATGVGRNDPPLASGAGL